MMYKHYNIMTRLYQYAPSNQKTGYFLRGATENGHSTFQVTPLAAALFDRLEYRPGTVNQEQGPRIANKLLWGLYEIGLVYTEGQEGPTSITNSMEFDLNEVGAKITDTDLDGIQAFIAENTNEQDKLAHLAKLLDLNYENEAGTTLWHSSDSRLEAITNNLESNITERIKTGNVQDWIVTIDFSNLSHDGTDKTGFGVRIKHIGDVKQQYYHAIYICEAHGIEKIATATNADITWQTRKRIEQHRSEIFEAFIDTAETFDFPIGNPTAEMNLLTHKLDKIFE